jgi:hypothetical protein
MRGSQKQIKWANEIKESVLNSFNTLKYEWKNTSEEDEKYFNLIKDIDEAEFWIEIRVNATYGDFKWMYEKGLRRNFIKV